MKSDAVKCVLLADRHHGLTEGMRGLLETSFEAVVMVADETSLLETAERLRPTVVVADLALAPGENFGWLRRLLKRCPKSRVIVLSTHGELSVVESALEAGAVGFVFKREIASQLLDAVEAVIAGRGYVPPSVAQQILSQNELKSVKAEKTSETNQSSNKDK